jgi:hypothetical protein
LLIAHGADPNIRGNDNKSTYDIVKEHLDRLTSAQRTYTGERAIKQLEGILPFLKRAKKKGK